MRESTKKNKEILLKALLMNGGYVRAACSTSGLSVTQHYQWLKDDPDYLRKVESVIYEIKLYSESKIFAKAIEARKVEDVARLFRAMRAKEEKLAKMEPNKTNTIKANKN